VLDTDHPGYQAIARGQKHMLKHNNSAQQHHLLAHIYG
jgi:hypothetical protein